MEPVLDDNIRCVIQAVELVETLSATIYNATSEASLGASIGGHIRHNIDHYCSFLGQSDSGQVDYDARNRDPMIELDPGVAYQRLQSIAMALGAFKTDDLDRSLRVRTDSGTTHAWSESTVRRELQFLLSHSIHHYAIIAMICRIHEVELPDDFGVAPSTLKFRQNTDGVTPSCAH